jgi:hypothetical protein
MTPQNIEQNGEVWSKCPKCRSYHYVQIWQESCKIWNTLFFYGIECPQGLKYRAAYVSPRKDPMREIIFYSWDQTESEIGDKKKQAA